MYNVNWVVPRAIAGVLDDMNVAFDVLYWETSSAIRLVSPSFYLGMHIILLLHLCQVDFLDLGRAGRVVWSLGYNYLSGYVHCWIPSGVPVTHRLAAALIISSGFGTCRAYSLLVLYNVIVAML